MFVKVKVKCRNQNYSHALTALIGMFFEAAATTLDELTDTVTSQLYSDTPSTLRIYDKDVCQIVQRQEIRKAPGPDGAHLSEVPSCFNNHPDPQETLYYRPVALTPVVMKSFKILMLVHLKDIPGPLLDTTAVCLPGKQVSR